MTMFIIAVAASMVAAYLIGSVSFAIIVTKAFMKKDIRDYGSGNAGMTNVLRTAGKLPGALTFLGDFLKGAAAVLLSCCIMLWLVPEADVYYGEYAAMIGVLLGHMFPVYYGFKGGKGIAVTAGAMLVVNPLILLIMLLVFAAVVLVSRYVSLASIFAAIAFPIATFFVTLACNQGDILLKTVLTALIAAVVIVMHRSNIKRLVSHTENKIGSKNKK